MYSYRADIEAVYDGDTVTANIDLGFHVWLDNQKIRLLGIDAPELRGQERPQGLRSRNALARRILGQQVMIETRRDQQEKYGRWLGTILLNGENINQWLLDEGLAVPWMER